MQRARRPRCSMRRRTPVRSTPRSAATSREACGRRYWRRSPLSMRGAVPVERERVDRRALPPLLAGRQLEDGEVQVRRILRGVAGSPHIADDVAAADRVTFAQVVDVAVEMG